MVAPKRESVWPESPLFRTAPLLARVAITLTLLAVAIRLHDRAGQLERRERQLGEVAGRLARESRQAPGTIRLDRAGSWDGAVGPAELLVGRDAEGGRGEDD